jgi:hypothetical protein
MPVAKAADPGDWPRYRRDMAGTGYAGPEPTEPSTGGSRAEIAPDCRQHSPQWTPEIRPYVDTKKPANGYEGFDCH